MQGHRKTFEDFIIVILKIFSIINYNDLLKTAVFFVDIYSAKHKKLIYNVSVMMTDLNRLNDLNVLLWNFWEFLRDLSTLQNTIDLNLELNRNCYQFIIRPYLPSTLIDKGFCKLCDT